MWPQHGRAVLRFGKLVSGEIEDRGLGQRGAGVEADIEMVAHISSARRAFHKRERGRDKSLCVVAQASSRGRRQNEAGAYMVGIGPIPIPNQMTSRLCCKRIATQPKISGVGSGKRSPQTSRKAPSPTPGIMVKSGYFS